MRMDRRVGRQLCAECTGFCSDHNIFHDLDVDNCKQGDNMIPKPRALLRHFDSRPFVLVSWRTYRKPCSGSERARRGGTHIGYTTFGKPISCIPTHTWRSIVSGTKIRIDDVIVDREPIISKLNFTHSVKSEFSPADKIKAPATSFIVSAH